MRRRIGACLASTVASALSLLASPPTPSYAVFAYTGATAPSAPDAMTTPNLRIYLARHGQDADNASGILNGHRDEPLTDLGVQQARTVATKIKEAGMTFDAVYSSPLQRARRTAEIIAEATGTGTVAGAAGTAGADSNAGTSHPSTCADATAVRTMDALIERDFGVMSGVPTSEITERCSPHILKTDTITYFLSPEGAETFPALIDRASRVIARITEEHSSKKGHDSKVEEKGGSPSVLLVTHGDFGKMLYAAYYELDWRDVLRGFHFGNSEVLLLSRDSDAEEAHVFEVEQYNH